MNVTLLSILFITAIAATSCINDDVTTSGNVRPIASVERLEMGTHLSGQRTPTVRFTLRNPSNKIISLSEVKVEGEMADCYRLNVDGLGGETHHDVEIRGGDSIYVLVDAEAISSEMNSSPTTINFTVNGNTSRLPVDINVIDVTTLVDPQIDVDTRWEGNIHIYGKLQVKEGASLSVAPGSTLYFHDSASIDVEGSLCCLGTIDSPIVMRGDRHGCVAADIPYDVMSRQWKGIAFRGTSRSNVLENVEIVNTEIALNLEEGSGVDLTNCLIRNASQLLVSSKDSRLNATGCEFSNAGEGLIAVDGGEYNLTHCTLANYYLLAYCQGAAIDLNGTERLNMDINNCLIYGRWGSELSLADLSGTNVMVRSTAMKSNGADDDNFIGCIWECTPDYILTGDDPEEKYVFDFTLSAESDLHGKASMMDGLTWIQDRMGNAYSATPGAYQRCQR